MAQQQRKYTVTEFREAIQRAGPSAALIASYLGCTRSTVYAYLRKYPELKQTYEQQKGAAVEERAQFPKEVFLRAIPGSHGVKAAVAAAVGCSRQTVDNALQKWPELAEMLDAERSSLVSTAVSALADDVKNKESDGHQRAYMFVLRTLGKDEGFSERTEVTGADGEGLFELSPEVARLISAMGYDMSQVAKQFEAMVRAAAAQKGVT